MGSTSQSLFEKLFLPLFAAALVMVVEGLTDERLVPSLPVLVSGLSLRAGIDHTSTAYITYTAGPGTTLPPGTHFH